MIFADLLHNKTTKLTPLDDKNKHMEPGVFSTFHPQFFHRYRSVQGYIGN